VWELKIKIEGQCGPTGHQDHYSVAECAAKSIDNSSPVRERDRINFTQLRSPSKRYQQS
jgi:hypothetical protein